MLEVWKAVVGYEGLYEVSNRGVVRSLFYHGGRRKSPKTLKPRNNRYGYHYVTLYKGGQVKAFAVHRLVAEAFIANLSNLPQVNHINEDKTDNRAVNLEWCTRIYNVNYGTGIERMAKAKSKTVLQFDKQGNFVREWPSTREVERQTGWDNSYISRCCLGKYKSSHGFVWRFADDVPCETVQEFLF